MNLFKRTAAVILAVTLLLSGCAGGNTTWAYKSGDTQIPTGLYIMYGMSAVAGLEAKVAEENPEAAGTVANKSELFKTTVAGQPAADWANEEVQKSVREYFAVKQKFEDMGLQLSEGDITSIDSSAKSVISQSGEFYDNLGVSENSIKEFYMAYFRKSMLFLALYDEGGESAVPEDELKEHFAEHYASVYAIPFYKPYTVPEGETKTLDELEAEVKANAEEYFKRLQDGEEIEQLAYDWQLENTDEANKATVEKPAKDDLRLIITREDNENFGDALIDAIFVAEVGVPEIIEDASYFVIFNRSDIMSDATAFNDYKSAILQELKGAEFDEKLSEWGADVRMESNTATIDKYMPNKLKLDNAPA